MNGFLLDVNLLIALAWPRHHAHEGATRWFNKHAHGHWATCPITECDFVQIISSTSFSPDALTISEALRLLEDNLNHPGHHFWRDDLNGNDALRRFQLVGHQQVTDAYLLALAIHNKGKLATLDKSIQALAGGDEKSHVELVSSYFT